jgi:large subunit ribosomal protein L4|tara:strand:+ start:433 stop:1062 length:630 start_codon:yes stop_codon:yes gene_type:complete
MKIDSISMNGKVTEFEISEKIFSSDINNRLICHVLYSQIANAKPRIAKTKQRNEIIGSTAKIYAQKGTGNARHASKKAPIFVGGGIAHGPKGNIYKVRKINKKEKKNSLISAISQKTKDKNLIIFEDVKNKINKTKNFIKFLKTNQINSALIVVDLITKKNIELSARNIANIKLIDPYYLNTYDILKYKQIMFTKSSTKELEKRLLDHE